MKIGIPRGLLYHRYHIFAKTFVEEIGAEAVVSQDTNKDVLDEGTKYCVDEACLPVKVFHGHVAYLRDRCDAIWIPRMMGLSERQYICPMFCGLPEMISNSIPGLPKIVDHTLFSLEGPELCRWAKKTKTGMSRGGASASAALSKAVNRQKAHTSGFNQTGYPIKTALIGHVYNIGDGFTNMNLVRKLNRLGIGVVTEEYVEKRHIDHEVGRLFKKPFWSLAQKYYGAAVYLCNERMVDGLIYLSSFSCGIDSVVIELIQDSIGDFPFMVLKLDEHTGEAGFDTRLEAFADMLERRLFNGRDRSAYGKHPYRGESAV